MSKPIPKLNKRLSEIVNEFTKKGITELLIIASDPKHPLGGGSVHYTDNTPFKDSPIKRSVYAFHKWEKENGISTKHDWEKDGWKDLHK